MKKYLTGLKELQRDFFTGNPVIAKAEIEGQRIQNDKYVLGCMAGPSCHISNLCHEMGHLAEREIPKLLERRPNWGYSYGKYWEVLGRSGYEPQTDQSVRREMRCWAYQWSILQNYGLPVSEDNDETTVRDLVQSAVYLPAFFLYKYNVHPACKQEGYGYSKGENEAIDIMAKEVETLASTSFTFKRFQEEWNTRMEALRNTKPSEA